MHEDNIESLWRKVMYTSADNCPMEFAKALAERAALAERDRWATAARLVIESTPEQLPMSLDALADVLRCDAELSTPNGVTRTPS
jgi:hypothetical protein